MIEGFYNALLVENRYKMYLEGLYNTFIITLFALLLGVIIGIIISILRYSTQNKKGLSFIAKICNLYITIIRGTPVLVQLLLIYNVVFVSGDINPIYSAIVCFGINSGAYVSEIFRAGIEAIDKGQMEASRSLGIPYITSMINIIVPQAFKNVLPTLFNEFIALIKETAIVGTIAITDITRAAQLIQSRTYDIIYPILITTLIYLVIVIILTKFCTLLERKLSVNNA